MPRVGPGIPAPGGRASGHAQPRERADAPLEGDGDVTGMSQDGRTAAIAAELAPYPWRGLTGPMLARRVVGAVDHHAVLCFVGGLPGADVGAPHPVEPAGQDDPRVDALVQVLGVRRWRSSSLDRLCADLVAVLDGWLADRLSASGPAPDDR
jgi:hypothetical protein